MVGLVYHSLFNSILPREIMTKQKSQVPKAKAAYAERKRRQNEKFCGFLKAYGLLKGPKLVLDDTDAQGKTLQSSAALIKAGVKAGGIDVPNIGFEGGRFLETDGSRLVKKIGHKMGVNVHPTDLLSFLRRNPFNRYNGINIDACCSFSKVKDMVREVVANHLATDTPTILSFTCEMHRTAHRCDDPLKYTDNETQISGFIRELVSSFLPGMLKKHIVQFQNGADSSNKMQVCTMLLSPAEEAHERVLNPSTLVAEASQVVYRLEVDGTYVRGLATATKKDFVTHWCDKTTTKGDPWSQFHVHLRPPADAQILGEERSYTDGLVGRKVQKKFGAGVFTGTIYYAQKIEDDLEWSYRIIFDDGDSADWSLEEVMSGLLPDDRKAAGGASVEPEVAKRGRGRPPKNP